VKKYVFRATINEIFSRSRSKLFLTKNSQGVIANMVVKLKIEPSQL